MTHDLAQVLKYWYGHYNGVAIPIMIGMAGGHIGLSITPLNVIAHLLDKHYSLLGTSMYIYNASIYLEFFSGSFTC